jgi:glycosyltransferase involved in cell wall biosynthesis
VPFNQSLRQKHLIPTVSICIPSFNQVKHLEKTLESILHQTFTDYEIIVTDDTPSDKVRNFIANHALKDKILYYRNSPPLGSPRNWNFCISKARGSLIKVLHHDDWFTYDHSLEVFVKTMEEHPEVNIAFSSSSVLLESGKSWLHKISHKQLVKITNNPTLLFTANLIGGPSSTIFRKQLNVCFDEQLTWLVDIDFYIFNLIELNRIQYISDPLVTTFAAQGRVSDLCLNNSKIEVYEYFYLFNKIRNNLNSKKYSLFKSLLYLINICKKYNLSKISSIREAGYFDKIPNAVKLYLLFRLS